MVNSLLDADSDNDARHDGDEFANNPHVLPRFGRGQRRVVGLAGSATRPEVIAAPEVPVAPRRRSELGPAVPAKGRGQRVPVRFRRRGPRGRRPSVFRESGCVRAEKGSRRWSHAFVVVEGSGIDRSIVANVCFKATCHRRVPRRPGRAHDAALSRRVSVRHINPCVVSYPSTPEGL